MTNTPTPLTDSEIDDLVNGLNHIADDHLHRSCRATVLDTIELIKELKLERDQLKKQFEISMEVSEISKGNTEAALNSFHAESKQRRSAEAERDKLKELNDVLRSRNISLMDERDKLKNVLDQFAIPHVFETKTK